MAYIEKLESVNKEIVIEDEGLKITNDALLLTKFIKKIWDKIRPKNAFDLLFFTMLCLIFNIIVLMYKLLK